MLSAVGITGGYSLILEAGEPTNSDNLVLRFHADNDEFRVYTLTIEKRATLTTWYYEVFISI